MAAIGRTETVTAFNVEQTAFCETGRSEDYNRRNCKWTAGQHPVAAIQVIACWQVANDPRQTYEVSLVAGESQVKLDHIVLLVSDLPKSVGFYEMLLPMLGFRKTSDHVFGNADEIVFDIRQAENLDHPYQRYAPGLNHIGFTAPNLDAISQIQEVMKDAGYEVPAVQSFDEGVALFLKDPDGMRIELGVFD